MGKKKWLLRLKFIFFIVFLMAPQNFSSTLSHAASEDGADEDRQRIINVEEDVMSKRKKSPPIKFKRTVESQIPEPNLPEGKTLIKKINVNGSTLLAPEAIEKIKRDYENKELTGRQIQKVTDLITRAYSREGYVTSYGYPDTRELSSGILNIDVFEGRTGTITIRGNQHYKTKLLQKMIRLKEGDFFNFQTLNIDIFRINRKQDIKTSIICDPDIETGVTDIVINVKDNMPIHVMLQMDNYGSEYILQDRFKFFLIHNNLTGNDDRLSIKLQRAKQDAHQLYDMEYTIPLNDRWAFNIYYMPFKDEDYYYSDNEQTDFEKHARKFYFYFLQKLIDKPGTQFNSYYGFIYYDIHWYTGGGDRDWEGAFRKDRFRPLWWGLTLNRVDKQGRWIVTHDLERGLNIWGASPNKSDTTSVKGGGSDYWKQKFYVARRQKLFWGIDFIGKMRGQLSSKAQPGVNVFGLGGFMGVVDNRGYPRAQAPGDSGIAFTGGFSLPPFGVSRTAKFPFSKTRIYDGVKLFTFYDWGNAKLRNPNEAQGQQKSTTLQSAGVGVTISIPDKQISTRLDVGWPVSSTIPKDQSNHGPHFWWSFTKGF